MGWIAALISTSVLVILWFWEVRRRLREQHSMVEKKMQHIYKIV